jgi:hypothetical protein
MQSLFDHFEKYLPFKDDEKKLFEGKIIPRKIKRRELILQAGFTCKLKTT